jgi:hypothetical protein
MTNRSVLGRGASLFLAALISEAALLPIPEAASQRNNWL